MPILPITITGSRRVLPKASLAVKPGKIQVVGAPIATEGYSNATVVELIDITRRAIMENYDTPRTRKKRMIGSNL